VFGSAIASRFHHDAQAASLPIHGGGEPGTHAYRYLRNELKRAGARVYFIQDYVPVRVHGGGTPIRIRN